MLLTNPWRTYTARVTVVGLSVSLLLHFLPPCAINGQKAIPTGSAIHRLDFKNDDFRKTLNCTRPVLHTVEASDQLAINTTRNVAQPDILYCMQADFAESTLVLFIFADDVK